MKEPSRLESHLNVSLLLMEAFFICEISLLEVVSARHFSEAFLFEPMTDCHLQDLQAVLSSKAKPEIKPYPLFQARFMTVLRR